MKSFYQPIQLLLLFVGVLITGQVLAETEIKGDQYIIFYHNDALGSPAVVTDHNGNTLWHEQSEPFGRARDRVMPTGKEFFNDHTGSRIGYTGHLKDSGSDLIYMKARFYDPVIGRFYSNDPVGFTGSNPMMFNRYAYANNNPYRFFDPTGMEGEDTQQNIVDEIQEERNSNQRTSIAAWFGSFFTDGADVADEIMVDTYSAENAVATAAGIGVVALIAKRLKGLKKGFGASFSSIEDIFSNPSSLRNMRPDEVQDILGEVPGWKLGTLNQGSAKGTGWAFREYTVDGNATGRYIRYHPGDAKHKESELSYWRVGSPETGKSEPIYNFW